MVAEFRRVRNVRKQHLHETISGSKDYAYVTVTFDRPSGSVSDSEFQVALSVCNHAILLWESCA